MAKSSDVATQPDEGDDDAPSEGETASEHPQRQEVPFTPADRDPQEWTEPGWQQGMFPGDPNTYDDPENPTKAY